MPSERQRKKTKDDTWGAEELGKSIKDAMRDDSAGKHRSRDKDSRDKTKDRERRKDRESKDKDRDIRKDREKDKEHRKDKDKDKEHRKDRDKEKDREHRKDRDKDREHRQDKDKERRKEKSRTDDGGHREDNKRKEKDTKDRNDSVRKDRKEKERKHRDREETNGEKKHRRDREDTKSAHDKERRLQDKEGRSDREKRKEEERRRRKKEERENGVDEKEKREETKEERRQRKEKERRKREEDGGESSGKHREPRKEKSDDSRDKNKSHHRSEENRSSRQEKKEEYIEDEILEDNNNDNKSSVQGDDGEYGYEDDFEDYEDDFEDEEDENEDDDDEEEVSLTREGSAEMDAVRRAMAAENQAMHSSSSRKSKEPSSSASSSRSGTSARSSRSFVNFVAAKQRQIDNKVWKHSQKRGRELMNLIELDVVNFDLFDMAPVKEYELYIKTFGRSDTKQAFVQCNDDNLDRDIQTDPIENREMWTQHPAEGVAASGGAGLKPDNDVINEADSLRLTKFLQKAGQAVNILLEEESSENTSGTLKSNQRSIVFSEGYTQLNSQLSFLEGRHVVQAQFHPVQTNLLLTVHSMLNKDSESKLSQRGLLCVWNINDPSRPQKILSCKSTPTCCCFSPTKSTFAFAGTVDGAVVVWDLREPAQMHQNHTLEDGEWTIRVPTFSTDGIQRNENHHSRVVTVQPIVAAEESFKASMQGSRTTDDMAGLSFQLASLEEKGVIHFSVVIEIDKPDQAGSESDLGLVPCGKIKLIKTSSVSLSMSSSRGLGIDTMKTFHMQLSPMDPNQFFVATDSGSILHGARHGGRIPPQTYREKLEIPVDIVQIDFSPFGLPVFLVACGDGSIRLYNITSDVPIITWSNSTNGLGIHCIQWSRSRPSVFYVMDKASKVYVWELLENDGAPVKTEQFTHASLTHMTLSNDHQSPGRSHSGKRPEMLVTDAKGAMDVHRINEKFSTPGRSELDDVTDLFHNMI